MRPLKLPLAAIAAIMTAAPCYAGHDDIVDTAVKAGSFKTLVAAVKAAGLVDTLKSKGPFTVFAPTDAAFAKLPEGAIEALLQDKDKLAQILTYHVLPRKLPAAEVVKLGSATTVQGEDLSIKAKNGKVFVDKARVIKTDILCSNGIIHVIDAVILPGKKATSKPARQPFSTADYFPLEATGANRYRKTTEGRGILRPRHREEVIERRPRLRGDDLRIRDSEGEFQDFTLGREGPAMKAQSMTSQGFTQTYQPALTLFPQKATIGEIETFAAIIKHKDRSGTHNGAIERRVTLEGVETLELNPAGRFVDCLRFRVVTINRPKLGESFIARQDETIWLARGIGEVKSVRRTRLKRGAMTFMDLTITLELLEVPRRLPTARNAARSF